MSDRPSVRPPSVPSVRPLVRPSARPSARLPVRPSMAWRLAGTRAGPWVVRPPARPSARPVGARGWPVGGPWGFINKDLYKNKAFISKIEKNKFSKKYKNQKMLIFSYFTP